MSKSVLGVLLAITALAVALPAEAGKGGPVVPPTVDPIVTHSSRNDNKVYAGINWNFGVRTGATVFVGVRAARVNADSKVHGAKAEISYVLSGAPMGLGEARLKYLVGNRDTQGEGGVGYSFAHQAFLVNGGMQAPFMNGGADYLFGKGFLVYIGGNTLDSVRKPRDNFSCPTGYTLSGTTCSLD
ncbi:MAG: hypothetical protein ACXWCV_03110 [Caldimonas sp.]